MKKAQKALLFLNVLFVTLIRVKNAILIDI
jgi:hypothetical protein